MGSKTKKKTTCRTTDSRLTEKRVAFLNYYLQGFTIYESAVKAGYSEATAKVNAYQWLKEPLMIEYIEKQRAKIDKTNIMSVQELQEWWTKLIVGDGEIDIKDKLRASELLAKSAGGFTDKIDMNTNQQVVFIDDIGKEEKHDEEN